MFESMELNESSNTSSNEDNDPINFPLPQSDLYSGEDFNIDPQASGSVWATMGVQGMTESKRININSLKTAKGM